MRIGRKELFLFLSPLPLLLLSLLVGPSDLVRPVHIGRWLLYEIGQEPPGNGLDPALVEAVVVHTRLPRALLTFLVGASLTASGTTLQALFRNPLVAPDILGLSSGAVFGAALASVVGWLPIQPSAFLFGLLAVGLSYFLALKNREVSTVSLILAGIIISAAFTALLTIVQFLTDPFKLQTIVHWTMGNLHTASWVKVKSSLIPILFGCVWLFWMRWRMNVLALGEEEARAVGLDPQREKLLLILPATLVASASVAVSGVIGMVGLAAPHMVRMMVGSDNTKALPVSFAFGGSFLLIVDDLSRTLASFEIPIGVFTTLIGGPFFVYLFKRTQRLFVGV
ncbi:MAG: iron ABC transporter permease [candidate division NC10 bacterium]|nr:iron ABC transporter permease [candidate division NC10 bacterium]